MEETDRKKDEIEELQRERRKELAKKGEEHAPAFFKSVFLPPIDNQTIIFPNPRRTLKKISITLAPSCDILGPSNYVKVS